MNEVQYRSALKRVKEKALDAVERALVDNGVDIIMGPGDSRLASVASAAGCPAANFPLGYARFNGRAHGLTVIARPREETALLEVMLAWDRSMSSNIRKSREVSHSMVWARYLGS